MSFVLDNSVALAWCFEDEQTPEVMTLLDRLAEEGAVAPQLWPIEALNALITAERRGRIDHATRVLLADLLTQLPIALDEETAQHLWGATAELAERHRLSAYDATYLELALRMGAPLATRDAALIRAAKSEGVIVLPAAA